MKETRVLPDVLAMIQSETNLPRRSIACILVESGKLNQFPINPQAYITAITGITKEKLNTCLMDGLRYEKIDDAWLYQPDRNPDRTVWDRLSTDSNVEYEFVKNLDANDLVKYYVKLPGWFTVDTPIGHYNPDRAIMLEDQRAFYLVRETKSTLSELERRGTENAKIKAAKAHYEAIDVNYGLATIWSSFVGSLPRN